MVPLSWFKLWWLRLDYTLVLRLLRSGCFSLFFAQGARSSPDSVLGVLAEWTF